jgi:acyl-CoA-binding protein
MDLNAQFQAAADKVNNLPGDQAAKYMTELYGLFKQATEGDVNMQPGEVDPNAADNADGNPGMSQAQWDSWNQFKGVAEDEAKRRYVAKTAEITGAAGGDKTGGAAEAGEVPTDGLTGAPSSADHGGLKGDIRAGAPYGSEEKLMGEQ